MNVNDIIGPHVADQVAKHPPRKESGEARAWHQICDRKEANLHPIDGLRNSVESRHAGHQVDFVTLSSQLTDLIYSYSEGATIGVVRCQQSYYV